jgi:hypothetical protein
VCELYFLIVGYTKNAADRLFNFLKIEYQKQNIFTMESLVDLLTTPKLVTVLLTSPNHFFAYNKQIEGRVQQFSREGEK